MGLIHLAQNKNTRMSNERNNRFIFTKNESKAVFCW